MGIEKLPNKDSETRFDIVSKINEIIDHLNAQKSCSEPKKYTMEEVISMCKTAEAMRGLRHITEVMVGLRTPDITPPVEYNKPEDHRCKCGQTWDNHDPDKCKPAEQSLEDLLRGVEVHFGALYTRKLSSAIRKWVEGRLPETKIPVHKKQLEGWLGGFNECLAEVRKCLEK